MTRRPPNLLGSLIPERGDGESDHDAVEVLDPDTYVGGVPLDALARLRERAPVHPVSLPGLPVTWLITTHADVRAISRDHATFSSATGNTLVGVRASATSAMLPGLDPPRHLHVRKLVNQGFTARTVSALEPRIRAVAKDIVAHLKEKGEFDAVTDVAAEMSLQVIADVLGVPSEDRMNVFRWSNAIGSLGIEDPDYAPSGAAIAEAAAEMFAYCDELVAHRRQHGSTDDVLSALLDAEVDGHKLDRDQLNEFFMLLSIAGSETTRNTISHGILALSERPEQRAAMSEGLPPTAVDELLRWASPVMHFRRTATRDIEVRDVHIEKGDWVLLHYLSANRDGDVFDRPDTFDVTREAGEHVAFGGGGVHFCLGAQLARLELRVLFGELYAELPDLVATAPPTRLRSSFFNGIKRLPCTTGGVR